MDQMEAKRRRDFLAELAKCGNITLAAERAKVSRSWAMNRRRDDPAFREEGDAAIRAAHARLAQARSSGPGGRWRAQDGHELVIQHGRRTFVQVRRAGRKQWTPRTEARFLQVLAATCNVTTAVRETGTTAKSAYRHRERWPDFGRRWDAALRQGYQHLSTLIVANAGKMLGIEGFIPEIELTGMTADIAVQTLQLYHRDLFEGGKNGRKRGWWRQPADPDAMRAELLRKIECVRLARSAAGASAGRENGDRASSQMTRPDPDLISPAPRPSPAAGAPAR